MRDSKALFFLILALALATVSFVLISVWGYHYYFQKKSDAPASITIKAPDTNKNPPLDSLKKFKDTGTLQLRPQKKITATESDTLNKTLELKILEYNQLKEEIAEMLKNKAVLKSRMEEIKKIGEVQKNIDSLKDQKEAMIMETERMNHLLKQKQRGKIESKSGVEKSVKSLPASSLPLLISHLKFEAVKQNSYSEIPTMLASEANKLQGSFEININSKTNVSPDIFIKIIQPNGRPVLNASSGFTVLEKDSEKSGYTLVLHYDKAKDNHKRFKFSAKPNEFHKGKYTMQVYHQGVMIGRTQRSLM